jgi:hypothetical protein
MAKLVRLDRADGIARTPCPGAVVSADAEIEYREEWRGALGQKRPCV